MNLRLQLSGPMYTWAHLLILVSTYKTDVHGLLFVNARKQLHADKAGKDLR